MNFEEVHHGISKHRRRRRIGRGTGSGFGKTCGRGHKGARSRAGWSARPAFEGGQTTLGRRIPKRGFNNRWAKTVFTLNVSDLEAIFESGESVTLKALRAKGRTKGNFDVLKILGDGQLTKKLDVAAHRFSQSAKEKIESAGGQVTIVSESRPQAKRAAKKGSTASKKGSTTATENSTTASQDSTTTPED